MISSPQKVRALTYNIDTNMVRTEEGIARDTHPEWRANARAVHVQKTVGDVLLKKRPEIVSIQEGRQCETRFGDTVDSVSPLLETFKDHE